MKCSREIVWGSTRMTAYRWFISSCNDPFSQFLQSSCYTNRSSFEKCSCFLMESPACYWHLFAVFLNLPWLHSRDLSLFPSWSSSCYTTLMTLQSFWLSSRALPAWTEGWHFLTFSELITVQIIKHVLICNKRRQRRLSATVIDDTPGDFIWWVLPWGTGEANLLEWTMQIPLIWWRCAPSQYPCQGECDNESKIFAFCFTSRGEKSERKDDRPNYSWLYRPGQLFLLSRTGMSLR